MNKVSALLAVGMISLLPLSALAADAPPSGGGGGGGQPATRELRGFDKYWSKIDPTGKGFISKDDWLVRAANHFKEIDTNGDGKITKEEMKIYDDKMYQERQAKRAQLRQQNQQGGQQY